MQTGTDLFLESTEALNESDVTLGNLFVRIRAHTTATGAPGTQGTKGHTTTIEHGLITGVLLFLIVVLESILLSHCDG